MTENFDRLVAVFGSLRLAESSLEHRGMTEADAPVAHLRYATQLLRQLLLDMQKEKEAEGGE